MNRKRIYKGAGKRSPASPASPSAQPRAPANTVSWSQSETHGACARSRCLTVSRCGLHTLSGDQGHLPADPVVLERLGRLLAAVGPTIGTEFSADWLARAVSRFDGGPALDPPRLGPSLRQLGFVPLRRRRGNGRVSVWLFPGTARPRRGRPSHPAER